MRVGGGVVRAHVGVRLGAARRRGRHARVRRRHAGGLGRRLALALRRGQLHRRLRAARRLPAAAGLKLQTGLD